MNRLLVLVLVLAGVSPAVASLTRHDLGLEWRTIASVLIDYDDTGNLGHDEDGRGYEYDEQNRLTRVFVDTNSNCALDSGETQLAAYTYDALGRRVTATIGGATTRFYYDGQRVIEERDAGDAVVRYHVNGGQFIDEHIATYDAAKAGGSDAGRAAGWTYYLLNANYSIAGTGDASGTMIERLDYSASGDFAVGPAGTYAHDADADADMDLRDLANLQVCFGTTVPACLDIHDFDLDGQSNGVINIDDFDGFAQCFNGPDFAPRPGCEVGPPKIRGTVPETGMFTLHGWPIDVLPDGKVLMDFRTRIYDPQHGRWLQRDPSGYVDGGNLYESFRGNAARHVDPSGRDVWVTADARELTDATGREWWEITYTRHRNKLYVGYVFTFYQWWWDEWDNPNFSETERIVEYFPRREGINIWNRIAAEQERLVEDFTANADAKAYRDAIVLAASAPIQIATAGTAQTIVALGAARIGVSSSTALGRIAISSATNALVTGAGEAGGTAVLLAFGEATIAEVGEAGLRGVVVGGVTGGLGRAVYEVSPTLQSVIPDSMLARSGVGGNGAAKPVSAGVTEARYLEYRALRLQGLTASEAHKSMKLFDAGVSGGYAFHFTTTRGGRGIIDDAFIRSGSLGLRGTGVYAGTTSTPSFLLKHGPPPFGWALGATPVRIPIQLHPDQAARFLQVPPRTVLFPGEGVWLQPR